LPINFAYATANFSGISLKRALYVTYWSTEVLKSSKLQLLENPFLSDDIHL
jgi:hypothetical protein